MKLRSRRASVCKVDAKLYLEGRDNEVEKKEHPEQDYLEKVYPKRQSVHIFPTLSKDAVSGQYGDNTQTSHGKPEGEIRTLYCTSKCEATNRTRGLSFL